jgi:hypothetical protein
MTGVKCILYNLFIQYEMLLPIIIRRVGLVDDGEYCNNQQQPDIVPEE